MFNALRHQWFGHENLAATAALMNALNDSDSHVRRNAASVLGIGNAETLAKLIQSSEINIYDEDIFLQEH